MGLRLERVVRWAGLLFGVVALFFAYSYLATGFAAEGTTGDKLKGAAWIVLAVVVWWRMSLLGRRGR